MTTSAEPGPDWVEHAIWWQVYPLGFAGADTTGRDRSPGAGLDRLTAWLDYAVELGVNGVALGPIFASATHGYDTVDYLRIDERLGDRAAFDRLVAAAHERGMRVMLDGVFDHVGPGFTGDRQWLARRAGGSPVTFEGHDGLYVLDHSQPAVTEFVASVMTHWLDAGVDAWRLDAAYAVPPQFWRSVLPRVRAAHPQVYVMGEVLHGDYADYVARSGVDAVTQYELWKAIWSSLDSRNFFELDWTLQRHNTLLEHFVPFTFVGNHDVTRLASAIGDERHRAHAVVLLMTLGGTPAIYYGDEQGLAGVKEERVGGDDAVRPAYPSTPTALEEPAQAVLRLHQQLIGLRRRHPWTHRARSSTLLLRNDAMILRMQHEDDELLVALNLVDAPLAVEGASRELNEGAATRSADGWAVDGHGWAVFT